MKTYKIGYQIALVQRVMGEARSTFNFHQYPFLNRDTESLTVSKMNPEDSSYSMVVHC